MAINVTNVTVLEPNPAPFLSPFQFDITFECLETLTDDLEWKLTYVGSSHTDAHDQTLDTVLVGPIPLGTNRFTFAADPPDAARIPGAEVASVTVALLTCAYRGREFVRVGYYVNNEYEDELLREEPPEVPDASKITRNILADKPRVTRFQIPWDEPEAEFGDLVEAPAPQWEGSNLSAMDDSGGVPMA
eukprot:TRINITY_DN1387_c1_g2_i3.p2 TRINITY_DN1387_c1_g2~~TRINITY_DN1387_c1_g2_i3.p2  ORF type:complete len:189 (+),score=47.71 TRINITY_DN1387_c1_g2_i3:154-720(+)